MTGVTADPSKPGPKATFWTDERVEELKKLWAQGLSASQIAGRLGSVTRNSVISKVHRLGLSGRARQKNPTPRPRAAAPKAKSGWHRAAANSNTSSPAPRTGPYQEMPQPAEYVPREGEKVTILRARDDGKLEVNPLFTEDCCRYGIGDPRTADFHFCGKTKVPGLPYCEFHARRCFDRAPTPKRQIGVAAPSEAGQTAKFERA